MSSSGRRSQFKTPPAAVTSSHLSQEARRSQALEDQKRRRALRIDAERNLDVFANLDLGPSDDEGDDDDVPGDIVRDSLAAYVPLLAREPDPPSPSTSKGTKTQRQMYREMQTQLEAMSIDGTDSPTPAPAGTTNGGKKKRKGKKSRGKGKASAKWADKCMYAELLEMLDEPVWAGEGMDADGLHDDGLPKDLEGGFVSLAPVPAGKRCLAVTYQSSGAVGVVSNTHLRSRLLGKSLVRPFPSSLPPHTILDCILDVHWRDNGILHVLDVIKWKGQDVGDCETPFRFWFRDSRLSEIPATAPPITARPAAQPAAQVNPAAWRYRFPYPTTLLPIPYDADTSPAHLLARTIPLARASRVQTVVIPCVPPTDDLTPSSSVVGAGAAPAAAATMAATPRVQFTFSLPTPTNTPTPAAPPSPPGFGNEAEQLTPGLPLVPVPVDVTVCPDGLLLYVAQACYEPGTSPLSSWVPIASYDETHEHATNEEGGAGEGMDAQSNVGEPARAHERMGRLDLFERLVRARFDSTSGNGENAMLS